MSARNHSLFIPSAVIIPIRMNADPITAALLTSAGFATWSLDAWGAFSGSREMGSLHGIGEAFDLSFDSYVATYVHPDDRELALALRTGDAKIAIQYRIRRTDGAVRWLECHAAEEEGRHRGICRDVTEQRQRQRELDLHYALAGLAGQDSELETFAPHILEAIGRSLDWDFGEFWQPLSETEPLQLIATWTRSSIAGTAFDEETQKARFQIGVGIPGSVWKSGKVVWERDLPRNPNLPRAVAAASLGFHSAVGIPVVDAERVVAVLVFHARHIEDEDSALLRLLEFAGLQIGEYVRRRAATVALRSSEARYRALAQSASDAILTIDSRGLLVFANDAAARIFGWSIEEMLQRPLANLMPQRLRGPHDAGLARYFATGVKNIPWSGVELPGLHRSGHEIPLEIAFSEFFSEGERFVTGVARDISERQRDQRALQLVADSSRALAETVEPRSIPAVVAELWVPRFADWCLIDVLDDSGRPGTAAIVHRDPVQAERARRIALDYPLPHDAAAGPPAVLRTGRSEIGPVDGQLIDALSTGAQHRQALVDLGFSSYICVPIAGRGRILGALTLIMSESARVFDEKDLTLAQELASRLFFALENANLLAAAQNLNRAKDDFLAQLSHELRTPITSVLGYARLIAEGGMTQEELRDAAEAIANSAEAEARLVEELLDISRAVTGKFHLDLQPIDLDAPLRAAVAAMQPSANARGVHLRTDEVASCRVMGDVNRLQQVIWNLLSNAIKFTPKDGVVRISVLCASESVTIEVRDTGAGIDPDFLPLVFDRFSQAQGSDARGGLGLGLSIVRHLVELHGGTVAAESAGRGLGSTFRITLPRLQ